MAAIFDYTSYLTNPTGAYVPYNPQDEVNRQYIKDQHREDYHLNMFFDEQHREDGDADMEEAFNREVLNTFLTSVCEIIDVDPAEAIAQEFTLYLPMVEWLWERYHQQVVQKFEEKLQQHYHWICETVYDKITEAGHFTETNLTKSLIARELQRYFRNIIDHTFWLDINIFWILTLSEGDVVEACEENMLFDDIALILNEVILATEHQNQA